MAGFAKVRGKESGAESLLKVEKRPDGISIITINRPQALNALTRGMFTDLARIFKALDRDPDVKVIILTGAGRAFCSGVDLTAAKDVFKGDVKDKESDPVIQMEACSKPIIGAINGYAVTAGFEISLACDILIASNNAKFIDTHCKFGIFPSWGLSQKLPRIIGVNRARELSFTSKPLDALSAEKWGLVNRVVQPAELMEHAIETAEAIASNQQDMVLRYKSILNDGFKLPLGDGSSLEKERAHKYYDEMKPEQFALMHEYISGRPSKASKPLAKL